MNPEGRDLRSDTWHVAGHAITAGSVRLVMRMLLKGSARTVRGMWPVTHQAHLAAGLDEQFIIVGAVRIVAGEAFNAMRINAAGYKVVSLFAVFVRRAIRPVVETAFAKMALFEPVPGVHRQPLFPQSLAAVHAVLLPQGTRKLGQPLLGPLKLSVTQGKRWEHDKVQDSGSKKAAQNHDCHRTFDLTSRIPATDGQWE